MKNVELDSKEHKGIVFILLVHTLKSYINRKPIMCLLKDSLNPVYMNIFYKYQIIIVIAQFQDIITMNCQALTCCMNVSYVIDHEQESDLLFQCIMSVLWVLIIFWYRNMKCSSTQFTIDYLYMLVMGDELNVSPDASYDNM
jgi:hypothetical protein